MAKNGGCAHGHRSGPGTEKRSDFAGAPDKSRTCDLRFRKPLLYPLSYGGKGVQIAWLFRSRSARHTVASRHGVGQDENLSGARGRGAPAVTPGTGAGTFARRTSRRGLRLDGQ